MKKVLILIFVLITISCEKKESNEGKSVKRYCNVVIEKEKEAKKIFLDLKRKEAMRIFEFTNHRKEFQKIIRDEIEITEKKLAESENNIVLDHCVFLEQLNNLEVEEYNPFTQTINEFTEERN